MISEYVRPAGFVRLYPKDSVPYFGNASADAVELYDVVSQTGFQGTPSFSGAIDPYTNFYLPDLIFCADKYLALMPTAVEDDTELTDFPTSSIGWTDDATSNWEELRPARGPLTKRLVQVNASPTVKFHRVSSFHHGVNSSFGFRIRLGSVAPEVDTALGTPFAAVTWGGEEIASCTWGIFFPNGKNPAIAEKVLGNWVFRAELPDLRESGSGSGDTGDTLVIVEHIRNSMVVTVGFLPDQGTPLATDDVQTQIALQDASQRQGYFSRPDGSVEPAVAWNSGKFHVWGVGRQMSFGFNMVTYRSSATYTSVRAPLVQPRLDVPTAFIYGNANGGLVTATNLNGFGDFWFQYRLNFSPHTHTIGGRVWYQTPDVEAVAVFYPAITQGGYVSPGDKSDLEMRIESVEIEKPAQLDQSVCTVTAFFPDGFNSTTANWRWRPAQVWLGGDQGGGSVNLVQMFSGYITAINGVQRDPKDVRVTFTITSGAIRLKKSRFGNSTAPRGGRTLNQILTLWMQQVGIPFGGYFFDVLGDLITLPVGRAEDPAFRPQPGEDAWRWHAALCAMHGLELTWTDDGYIRTYPKNAYVPSGVIWDCESTDSRFGVEELTIEEDMLENFTRLIVTCRIPRIRDGLGRVDSESYSQTAYAWAQNLRAEQDVTYIGFRPWAERREETLEIGPTSVAFISLAVYNLAEDFIRPRAMVNVTGEFTPEIGRRYLLGLTNDNMQAENLYIIEALSHQVRADGFRGKTAISAYRYY